MTGGAKFLFPSHWGRNHRKLLVVDRTAAYLGGYNIGRDYANRWRDTHARYSGDMVVELENAFVDYWNHYGGRPALPQPARRTRSREMRVHRNLPADMVYPIRNMYLEAIDRADTRVWLTTAYLIPDDAFVRSLVQAAQRGVDVRLIVPHFSNHIVADWLSRVTYERLLQGGVRLLRFENAMVHAKTATIDGIWSTIGTANIDRLSLGRQLRGQHGDPRRRRRPTHGGDLRPRLRQLHRADARRVDAAPARRSRLRGDSLPRRPLL
uniref:Phospholipase D-like domain-containing protein n=1 Tax=Janibacter limosus TaxID=53458 RepID=A0AC61U6G9_9MICO|nr:phospholipase D-like domain-containing protein [Janibacter limosus]